MVVFCVESKLNAVPCNICVRKYNRVLAPSAFGTSPKSNGFGGGRVGVMPLLNHWKIPLKYTHANL